MSNYNDFGGGMGPYPVGNPGGWQGNGQRPPKRFGSSFFAWIRHSGMMRGDNRWIGGVCSGLAARLGWNPTLVRGLVLGSAVFGGFGLALYAIAWALLPDARDGRILGEELVAGRWDWNMLGAIIVVIMALVIPGVGMVSSLCAALVLWVLVQSANRQVRGYGFGYHGPRPDVPDGPTNGGMPNGGTPNGGTPSPTSFGGTPTGMPNGGTPMPQGTSAPYPYAGSAGVPQQPNGYPNMYPNGSPNFDRPAGTIPTTGVRPAAGATPAVGAMPLDATVSMTSPYRSAKPPKPLVERRKSAGFALTIVMLGLILVSIAGAMMVTGVYTDSSIESIIRVATIWIAGVCLTLGLTIVILGLCGRRSGGLIPIAWLAAITAVGILGANVAYGYVYNEFQNSGATVVGVEKTMRYGKSAREMQALRDGVRFEGQYFSQGMVEIDMTDAMWSSPHSVRLSDDSETTTSCPTGEVTISAYRSRVYLTLPEGCTFGFGRGFPGSWQSGMNSVGSQYSVSSGIWDFTFDVAPLIYMYDDDGFYGSYGGSRNSMDCDNGSTNWGSSSDYVMPMNGPELIVNVPYTIQGRVSVRYVSAVNSECPFDQLIH